MYTETTTIETLYETRTRTVVVTVVAADLVRVETTEIVTRPDGSTATRRTSAEMERAAALAQLPAGVMLPAPAQPKPAPRHCEEPERSWAWQYPTEAPTCAPARPGVLRDMYLALGGMQ